jgi:HK97 family phage major capsid protein
MLSQSQIEAVEAEVNARRADIEAQAVSEFKAKQINKRFSPAESEDKSKSKTGGNYFMSKELSHEFEGFSDFLQSVIKVAQPGGFESDPLRNWSKKTAGYLEEGSNSAGGYLVPTGFSNAIIEKSLEDEIVYPRAIKQPMTTNRLEIVADMDANHSTSYFSGITLQRPGEGGLKTRTSPEFGKIGLQLHKITGMIEVTDELLEDAIALEANITRKFAQAIAFQRDDDFLNGTGANMPIGVLNAANPALITVDAIGGQGAATVIWQNIRDMWCRMHPNGMNKCVWLCNPEVLPELMDMAISVGAGGVPVWMPANSVSNEPYRSLMGRPLIVTEKCQALGTAGDIALIDFSQYVIGEKGGLQTASSIHLRFDYDSTVLRFVLRYDGQPTWMSALTPKRGTKTLSPYIVLNSTRT